MTVPLDAPLVVSVRLGRRGQMVLPAEVRHALGLRDGDEILVALWPDGRVILRPRPKNYTETLAGAGEAVWKGADPVAYQRGERASWDD